MMTAVTGCVNAATSFYKAFISLFVLCMMEN